jgi:hypothetical protein
MLYRIKSETHEQLAHESELKLVAGINASPIYQNAHSLRPRPNSGATSVKKHRPKIKKVQHRGSVPKKKLPEKLKLQQSVTADVKNQSPELASHPRTEPPKPRNWLAPLARWIGNTKRRSN